MEKESGPPFSADRPPYSGSDAGYPGAAGRLRYRLYRTGGVDIVVTHAPARGYGDEDSRPHQGFAAFLPLLDKYAPQYLVHGHVHTRYGVGRPRVLQRGGTTIINACERYLLELPDPPANAPGRKRKEL